MLALIHHRGQQSWPLVRVDRGFHVPEPHEVPGRTSRHQHSAVAVPGTRRVPWCTQGTRGTLGTVHAWTYQGRGIAPPPPPPPLTRGQWNGTCRRSAEPRLKAAWRRPSYCVATARRCSSSSTPAEGRCLLVVSSSPPWGYATVVDAPRHHPSLQGRAAPRPIAPRGPGTSVGDGCGTRYPGTTSPTNMLVLRLVRNATSETGISQGRAGLRRPGGRRPTDEGSPRLVNAPRRQHPATRGVSPPCHVASPWCYSSATDAPRHQALLEQGLVPRLIRDTGSGGRLEAATT